MKKLESYCVKDGNNTVKYIWEIDTSKPPVYREGYEYKFNSELVGKELLCLS